jgi:hypothetical protein
MTDEKKPFSFAAPFTAPSVEPEPEPVPKSASTGKIEDIDTLKPGQTITITEILDDNVYTELVRKNSIDVKAGTLEITYSRTDERVNHNEWAEGGTLTVTRK